MKDNSAIALAPPDSKKDYFDFGGLGVDWRIDEPVTGERFARINAIYSLDMDRSTAIR